MRSLNEQNIRCDNPIENLVRYRAEGSYDETFGANGRRDLSLPIDVIDSVLLLQPDGRLQQQDGSQGGDFVLLRLLVVFALAWMAPAQPGSAQVDPGLRVPGVWECYDQGKIDHPQGSLSVV